MWVSLALDLVQQRNREPENKPVTSWGFVLETLEDRFQNRIAERTSTRGGNASILPSCGLFVGAANRLPPGHTPRGSGTAIKHRHGPLPWTDAGPGVSRRDSRRDG